jgi:hypothetical protein
MEKELRTLLVKAYTPAVTTRLNRFSHQDRRLVASWLIRNPVGTNCALQILKNLEDLSKKAGQAPALMLSRVLADTATDEIPPKALGKKIRDILHQRLHAQSTEHQERFQKFVESLNLPPDADLQPPQNFEGDIYTLQIRFTGPQSLKQSLETLLASMETSPWGKIKEF